ncbi:hypothetical protein THAOC_11625, partial [Thalassiosira oceanica]
PENEFIKAEMQRRLQQERQLEMQYIKAEMQRLQMQQERQLEMQSIMAEMQRQQMEQKRQLAPPGPPVTWDTRFDELVQYKAKHGDCNVDTLPLS